MKKILIVEDDITIHNLIKEVLEKNKYEVINAYSGTEALLLIEKERIDLILLDLMLPGLNGEEIVKKVKAIPIIVISAKISAEDKVNVSVKEDERSLYVKCVIKTEREESTCLIRDAHTNVILLKKNEEIYKMLLVSNGSIVFLE